MNWTKHVGRVQNCDFHPILDVSSRCPIFWGNSVNSTNCDILDRPRKVIVTITRCEQSEIALIRICRLWWEKWNPERESHYQSARVNWIERSESQPRKLERYLGFLDGLTFQPISGLFSEMNFQENELNFQNFLICFKNSFLWTLNFASSNDLHKTNRKNSQSQH
jgi:hypothetical protein